MIDWTTLRAEFPAAARYTYLNTAGAPPMSRRAAAAAQRYYAEMLAEGDLGWHRWLDEVEQVRRRVARLINADPDEVAFTASTSQAFNLIAALIGPPSHVVAMADEFPSATLPWLQRGDRVSFVCARAGGAIALADVEAALAPDTRAVVSSSVMYATGFRQDLQALGALCRRRAVRLAVDVTQSAGVFPIDVRRDGIDALAFSGYKWTMAGYGIAAMYVSRELLRGAKMPVAGWFSARDPEAVINDRLDLKDTAAALEVGCPPFAGIFALGGSLDVLDMVGQPAIERRVSELTDYLHARLSSAGLPVASPRDPAQRAGITVVPAPDAAAIVEALAVRGIIVSARGAGVRISVHIFNTEADIDRCVAALASIRRGEPISAHRERGPMRS